MKFLDYPWEFDDVEAGNIRGYLRTLLIRLWEEGEGFSGKRPFGNSGWDCDLMAPLVAMGAIRGDLDEDGYLLEVDSGSGHEVIHNLIWHIFEKK